MKRNWRKLLSLVLSVMVILTTAGPPVVRITITDRTSDGDPDNSRNTCHGSGEKSGSDDSYKL